MNVTIPVLEQLGGKYWGELVECHESDANEKSKTEKEEKEKESFSFSQSLSQKGSTSDLENIRKLLFASNQALISENHASMPELPPEA